MIDRMNIHYCIIKPARVIIAICTKGNGLARIPPTLIDRSFMLSKLTKSPEAVDTVMDTVENSKAEC